VRSAPKESEPETLPDPEPTDPAAGSPPESPAESPPEAVADPGALRSAWLAAIEATRGKGLGGEAIGLKGATIGSLDGAVLNLRVPPGLAPDLSAFLEDRARSASFRKELALRLGLDPERIRFEIGETGPRRRLTAETARDQKLEQMMETDPRLRAAVQTLDLKLKE